tara:strand:+ start:892 stop:3294 length:2403 start_codon:yes stop_codon:yes gene_type:complete
VKNMKKIEREAVMEALRAQAPRAQHVAELCGHLNIPKSQKDEVLDALEQLVNLNMVTEMPGLRFRLKRTRPGRAQPLAEVERPTVSKVRGTLMRNPKGFAFLTPDDGSEDVFVPPQFQGAALHGDRVELLARPSPKGREGKVVQVLDRRPARFTATLEKRGRRAWLTPDDPRLPERVELIGDAPKAKDRNMAVIARMVRFPQGSDDTPGAEIVDLLGVQGMTAVEVQKIKIREGVMEEFDERVLAEAREVPEEVPEEDKVGRRDLRDLDLCTIDPEDARDHDDAIFCERTKSGWRVVIAIADVSHYVRPGTAIDQSAFERCCSIYLPDRAIPMLPRELSSHLASLIPDTDRLCMGVEIGLTKRGKVRSVQLFEGVMRSRAKLTYRGVARALGLTNKVRSQPEAEDRIENLEGLRELAGLLREKRRSRGALELDLPEPKVVLDQHGVEPVDVQRAKDDPGVRVAYQMVEEMMLLANEVVAAEMKKRGVPAIYRIHGKPDEKKILLFSQLAAALGHDLDVEDARNPKELTAFLRRIEGKDGADVLQYLLLRSMQQAVYGIDSETGHFGLATKDYLHFTSPIRRYPDLAVHRVLKKVLRGEPIDAVTLKPHLASVAARASQLERRAFVVERDVVNLYRAILMRDRVGEDFDGVISSVDRYGVRVAFDDPYVEALIPLQALEDDYYELDDLGIRLIGARSAQIYELGERIQVELTSVEVASREILAVPTTLDQRKTERRTKTRGRGRSRSSREGEKRSRSKDGRKSKSQSRTKAGQSKGGQTKRSESKGGQTKRQGKKTTRKRR